MLEDIRGIFHNPLKQVSSARRDTNFFAPFLKVLKFEIYFLMYLFINLTFEIAFLRFQIHLFPAATVTPTFILLSLKCQHLKYICRNLLIYLCKFEKYLIKF